MRVADFADAAFGEGVRSIILHGSLVAGGFRPGRSDVDVLIVADGPVDLDALESLARRADLGDAAGLDLHVVTAEAARTPTPAPPVELYVGRHDGPSLGVEIARRIPADPDLPTELSAARATGRALRGAPPHEVIGPVPASWVVARGRHWLRTWQSLTDDVEHAVFMTVTACRIWRFAAEQVHCSKAEAAAWALARDPSLIAVRQAMAALSRDTRSAVDERDLAALLTRVLASS